MRCGVTLSKIADGDTFFTDCGSPHEPVYSPVIDDNGQLSLTQTGKINIQEKINSYREQTDMAMIISRLMAGDDSVLYVRNPLYGDFSGCTYNNAEMLQNIIDARNAFDNLRPEVKEKFGNSFYDWFTTAGSESWAVAMSACEVKPVKPVEDVSIEEVK